MNRETAGQQIARARRRRGISQAVLAGLVGRSESWLSQVERGKRGIDTHSVLVRLAEVLGVNVEEITGAGNDPDDRRHAYPAAAEIEQAMMSYGVPGHAGERRQDPVMAHLRASARSAYEAYQATRYDAAGRMLPALIRDAETASRIAGPDVPAVCQVRSRI